MGAIVYHGWVLQCSQQLVFAVWAGSNVFQYRLFIGAPITLSILNVRGQWFHFTKRESNSDRVSICWSPLIELCVMSTGLRGGWLFHYVYDSSHYIGIFQQQPPKWVNLWVIKNGCFVLEGGTPIVKLLGLQWLLQFLSWKQSTKIQKLGGFFSHPTNWRFFSHPTNWRFSTILQLGVFQ